MTKDEIKNKFEIILLKLQQLSLNNTVQKFVFLLDPKEKLLCKGLITWKSIKTQLYFDSFKDTNNELDFIWQFARFDIKVFCAILQVQQSDGIKLINRLKNLNLIFPDGTVNTNAYGVLVTFTKKELEKKTGMKKKSE